MALITGNSTKKVEKVRNSIHGEVDWTYSTFRGGNGTKYFQIDTYGSKDREFQGKISQSLQFDKETAEEIIAILQREFGI